MRITSGSAFGATSTYHTLSGHAHLLWVGCTMYNRLPRLLHDLLFSALSADPFEMLKIASIDRCNVFSTEHTNFELLCGWVTWRKTGTGALQVFEVLVNDVVCAYVLRNSCRVAVMGDELG
jgi:hypothetical protein